MKKFTTKQFNECQLRDVQYLIDNYQVDCDIARLMVIRGVNRDNAEKYFSSATDGFYDAFLLSGMKDAVDIINTVMLNNGSILVFGDYDADGITASSVLKLFFDDNGVDCDVILPTREDGYGISVDRVLSAFEDKQYDLILTVDCGISNKSEIIELTDILGVDIVVTDHHELPTQLPECVCVNPKLGDYPFKFLSGSGVAWKLICGLTNIETAKKYAFVAAIGTIGDIMPLIDENRALVKLGLANINHSSIIKICKNQKIGVVTTRDIAMKVVPRINSAGRIGNPQLALDVMLGASKAENSKINKLDEANQLRQKQTSDTLQLVYRQMQKVDVRKTNCIVLYNPMFNNGVLGIVANKVSELYRMPAILLSDDKDVIVGSGRTYGEINLLDCFNKVAETLIKYGGHKASVGCSMQFEKLNEFTAKINKVVKADYAHAQPIRSYDVVYDDKFLTSRVFNQLSLLEPCSPNEQPVFYYQGCVTDVAKFGNLNNHIKFIIDQKLDCIGFNEEKYYDAFLAGATVEVLFKLDYDNYAKKPIASVFDIGLCNSINYDKLYATNLLLNKHEIYDTIDDKVASKLFKSAHSLIIVNSFEDYSQLASKFDLSDFAVDYFIAEVIYDKQVIIAPTALDYYSKCENVIICCDSKLKFGYALTDAKYYLLDSTLSYLVDIKINRAVCAIVYKLLKKNGETTLNKITKLCFAYAITAQQCLACICVFDELGIITFDYNLIIVNNIERVSLNDSILYNNIAIKE